MQQLLIFPYNGNGLEALDCIKDQYEFIGFVDDTPEKQGLNDFGFHVFSRTAFREFPNAKVLAVPGSPGSFKIRSNIINELQIPESRYATVIHPNANISPFTKIGYNTLIMAGVVITSNAVIGKHVILLPNTVIHHDTEIGHFTLVGSNVVIAGNTKIGENCYIGSGCNIINGISIGRGSLIGLGSNVISSLPENVKAVGNPSKII